METIISLIPITLFIAGYFIGKYLEKKHWENEMIVESSGKIYTVTLMGQERRGKPMDDHNGKYRDLEYPVVK